MGHALRLGLAGLILLAVGLLATPYFQHEREPQVPAKPAVPAPGATTMPEASYVGRGACASCHAEQDRLWQGSHHDLAMQEVTPETVLGDFTGTVFKKDGISTRFFRRGSQFMVNTDGPDGKPADFEVKYTFGFTPLQQYLLELPGGRLQALSIAWDSRPKPQGGQRWFHLYPGEKIDHKDELHWTRISQNWNYMCAECHSTNLLKNYDPATHSYHTTWSEIDVACEACHGPGSRHVAWARSKEKGEQSPDATLGLPFRLDDRAGAQWTIDPHTGNASRRPARQTTKEIETCARCHARRGQWYADYRFGEPLMNTHLPALLEEGLYHADGQIDGEVYEYGSFLQSRMFHAGVTCSDCHEPHGLKLRAEGDGICARCHAVEKYSNVTHHHHTVDSPGSHCVDCHMPTKAYMVIDPRRDHSFRIPRPDLSVQLGTPNACNGCHAKRSARWAADTLRRWLGRNPGGYQGFAQALHAARSGAPEARSRLLELLKDTDQPTISRATAVAELALWPAPDIQPAVAKALADTDPLIRAGGLRALESLPPERRAELGICLLGDPVRVIRALAGASLADMAPENLPSRMLPQWKRATEDYLAAQIWNADEPGAQVNIGNFYAGRGEFAQAESAYREALALNPDWVPAYVNLIDLLRETGQEQGSEALLLQGLSRQPRAAALHHALGLLQVRRKDLSAALVSLKRAVELDPENARFVYVFAVALDSAQRHKEALAILKTGLQHSPGDRALQQLWTLWGANRSAPR